MSSAAEAMEHKAARVFSDVNQATSIRGSMVPENPVSMQ
jgi:hypothetical protein